MTRIRRFRHDQVAGSTRRGWVVAVTVALTFGTAVALAACTSGPGVTVETSESVPETDESTVPTTEDVTVSSEVDPASTTIDRGAADSYAAGYVDGYAAGYADGYMSGGDSVRSDLSRGGAPPTGAADDSYRAGFDAGYDQGWSDGWDAGYDDALGVIDGTVPVSSPSATFPQATFPPTTTEANLTEYARITTWFTAAAADDSAWVHFKVVDGSGYTVQEISGSEIMNLRDEADGAAQTAQRIELVDTLRQMMIDDGWTETGVDGEWYEYTFGR